MGVIYKITNTINKKVYIGQTMQAAQNRWSVHKSRAKNKNFSTHLYNGIRKYGIENFDFEIIEQCSDNNLDKRERYWIQYYNSYIDGYNETIGGQDSKRMFFYEDICSQLLKGIDKEEVAKHFHCDPKTVYNASMAILGKNPSEIKQENFDNIVKDLYVNKNYNMGQIQRKFGVSHDKVKRSLIRSNVQIKNASESVITHKTKTVIQYDLDDNIIGKYLGVINASKATGVPRNSISNCVNGKGKTAYGYKWKYQE